MVLLQINNMSNKSLYQGYNYEVGCTKLSSERGIKNEREREGEREKEDLLSCGQ